MNPRVEQPALQWWRVCETDAISDRRDQQIMFMQFDFEFFVNT